MLSPLKTLTIITIITTIIGLTGCSTEDPGPIQEKEKEFHFIDFDRLEMGSGFHIEVKQSSRFRIKVEGDRRNIDDIDVFKSGNTLVIRYDESANRHHETRIRIEMPNLSAVNFSGGSVSEIEDFESDEELELSLSGGSVSQVESGFRKLNVALSGGSNLFLDGLGDEIEAEISGASVLAAFDYPVRIAKINVSGASHGKVTVTHQLDAKAEGASALLYRGSPSVNSTVSGASTIQQD